MRQPAAGLSEIANPWVRSPDWNTVTAMSIEAFTVNQNAVELCCDQAQLRISVIAIEGAPMVRMQSLDEVSPDYGWLNCPVETLPLTVVDHGTYLSLASESVSISVTKDPFSLDVVLEGSSCRLCSPTDGHFVRRHRVPPLAKTEQGWFLSLDLASDESVFGLGEKWGRLDKRGQLVRSYNWDALGVNAEISYKNTPFCWSHEGWGVFFNTPSPVTHAVGYAPWSQRSYIACLEAESLDVMLLLSAPTAAEHNAGRHLIGQYTALTGRAPLPPLWSTGVILSKAYYRTADEILEAARRVRAEGMPCDVITFDGRAWQDTDTRFAFEWDESRYPDPKPVIDELKALDFKICVWEYPLISVRHLWFDEFAQKGWLIKDSRTHQAYRYRWDQQAFGEVLTPLPESGLVDFTHPDAYAFWRDAHRPLFELGVDMIKADFGEQVEDQFMLAHNGQQGRALHNVYSYLYNRCVYEAAERYAPSGPFLFSRSSWTGCQRFNSQWGGDPQADWEGMMANLRGGLSWGLSGGPFYATDIGGFYKDTRDDALYVRWAQMAVFSAHFRLHGIGDREPWSYAPEAADAVMKALKLRYRLQAYLFNAMRESTQTGMPVQRSMALAFANQRETWSFENQFMLGDDLLIAPCFDPQGRVAVYLPRGNWIRFDPDTSVRTAHVGGQVLSLTLALDEMAVFAREDARIPLSPAQAFTPLAQTEPQPDSVWRASVE